MVALLGALLALGHPLSAHADAATILSNRVNTMLRADPKLNGASCYTASTGVIVLYGTVFDAKARDLAESKARKVHGVKQVINTLRTKTGKWLEEESRINDTLLLNDFQGVSARVIGNSVYVSGQVSSAAEQQTSVARDRFCVSIANHQLHPHRSRSDVLIRSDRTVRRTR